MATANWQRRLNAVGYSLTPDGMAGPLTYGALFSYMGARADYASTLGRSAAKHFPAYRIETGLRIAHWMAQFGHESSGFTRFEENLNYSAQRLCAVWPSRFPTLASAKPYANNPQALANKVYGGRMGNGPGEGWTFRGRGPMLTGKENYALCAARTGLDLVGNPDLAAAPEHFVHIACDFWGQACCNALADTDNLEAITVKINGGRIGLSERRAMLAKAKRILA